MQAPGTWPSPYKLSAFPEYTERADGEKLTHRSTRIIPDQNSKDPCESVKIRDRSHSLQDSLKLVTEECGQNTALGHGKRRATSTFATDRTNFFLPGDRVSPQECNSACRLQKLRPSPGICGISRTNIVGCEREISGKLQGLLGS